MQRFQGVFGFVLLIGLCALFSRERRRIRWSIVFWGVTLQVLLGFLILRTEPGRWFFTACDAAINKLLSFPDKGTELLFSSFVTKKVEPGFISLACHALPKLIFFSALMSALYYLRIMQFVVRGIAWVMQKSLGTSGAETLSCTASIFVGQTEAPLLIRPFLATLTRSELMAIMTGGFATIAGTMMGVYTDMLKDGLPNIAGHLMAASVMSVPAGLYLAKVLEPETGQPVTAGTLALPDVPQPSSFLVAVCDGAIDGLKLAANIAAMLLAFVSLIAMLDALLGYGGGLFGQPDLSLSMILGTLFRPIAWTLGLNWEDSQVVGALLGKKIVATEFLAYVDLQNLLREEKISPQAALISSYALCGFANLASIGVQIGGLSVLAPTRKNEMAELALRAMTAGAFATCLSAAIAGMMQP